MNEYCRKEHCGINLNVCVCVCIYIYIYINMMNIVDKNIVYIYK